jgi:16S rRNA processing protein RimM
VASLPPQLAVGRVARAHGIRGRVLVAPYNADSVGLDRVSRLWLLSKDGASREYKVERGEQVNLGYLFALQGVPDRTAAEPLRGCEVLVLRDELPALDEGEVYAADLIGLPLVDTQGVLRGTVEAVESAGPNDLLRLSGGALVPLAFVREIVDRKVVIEAPEGLFELDSE